MNQNIPILNLDKIHHLESVDSTNSYCKQDFIKPGDIVVANQQTAGRGRGFKTWTSLGEGNIFFSGKLVLESSVPSLSLLSLFVGGAVLRTLQFFSNTPNYLKIKWPNDIFLENKKIAGILIEGSTISNCTTLIIGIGINLFLEVMPPELPIATLYSEKCSLEMRDRIIHKLVNELNLSFQKLYHGVLREEIDWIWNHSYLQGKNVRTKIEDLFVEGAVKGLDFYGYLLVDFGGSIQTLKDTGEYFQIIEPETIEK